MADEARFYDNCGHPLDSEDAIRSLQYRIFEFQDTYPVVAAALSSSSWLILGSDIGGCHSASRHHVMTFALIAHDAAFKVWQRECEDMRQRLLPDRRRMSFKGLNDGLKRKALPTFLIASDRLNGVLASIVVEKSIGTLIRHGVLSDLSETVHRRVAGWKSTAVEQALRLSHLASILITRFSSPEQGAIWIADDDDAFANDTRSRQFYDLFTEVLDGYMHHGLGPLIFGTPSRMPFGAASEDLVALADFAAGTLSDWVPGAIESGMLSGNQISMLPVTYDKEKVNFLMRWYAGDSKPLKRLTIVVQAAGQSRFRVTSIAFLGREARPGKA